MSHIRTYLILLLITSLLPLRANEKYDYSIDTLTYKQYLNAEWELLYETAIEANKNDIYFYYLDLRAAYAAYYTQRYHEAVRLLDHAALNKEGENTTKELHYYAALYAGMAHKSNACYKQLSEEQKATIPSPQYKVLQSVSVSSGYNKNSSYDDVVADDFDGEANTYGARTVLKDINFQSLSFSHKLSPTFSIYHSLEHLTLNKVKNVTYTLNNITSLNTFENKTKQLSYYINSRINLNDHIYITPTFNYIKSDLEFTNVSFDETNSIYTFTPETQERNFYLYNLIGAYRTTRFDASLHGNLLTSDTNSRWQYGASLTYYPSSNRKQYFSTSYSMHDKNLRAEGNQWEGIWQAKMGWQLLGTWFEINHIEGNQQFYSNNNGATIYNTSEEIMSQTGANISIPFLQQKLWLNIYYRHLNYQSTSHYTDEELYLQEEDFTHDNHSITGGLTWYL